MVNPPDVGYQVTVHNSCTCNELVSLRNRHLVDRTLGGYDRRFMLERFREVSKDWALPVKRYSYQQVVDCYTGSKKRAYTYAMLEVRKFGIRKHDHLVRMFVKPDKYAVDEIELKAPRAIQYRHTRYNLVLASYLKPFEEMFYQLPGRNGLRVVTKGLSPVAIADLLLQKVELFNAPVYISCDHSKFDSTINVDHLKFEHAIYKRVYKDRELKQLLSRQMHNKGFSRNGIQYSVRGTRMSGDYNTGLGNSLINRAVLEAWLKDVKHEIMLDGDDAVVIVEASDVQKLDENFMERCGFTTRISSTHELQEVEYCKRRMCFSQPPVMVRNPIRALSNFAITTYNYGALGFERWARGTYYCEQVSNKGVPIFRSLPTTGKKIIDADSARKVESELTVKCTVGELAQAWQLDLQVVAHLDKAVSKYLGWNCSNDASSAISKEQDRISQRFRTLCTSADECWSKVSASTLGTTTESPFTTRPCPGAATCA